MRKSILFLALVMLCSGLAMAAGKEKMKGVNGINFGWKFEKCVEAIGDVPRKLTRDEGNDEKRFSYSPATWAPSSGTEACYSSTKTNSTR